MGEELMYVQMSSWSMHIGERSKQQKGLWGREQCSKFNIWNQKHGQHKNNVYTQIVNM